MSTFTASQWARKKIKEVVGAKTVLLDLSCVWSTKTSKKLKEIPDIIGRATQLRTLDLSHNRLRVLTESLKHLGALERLHLSHNELELIEEWLGTSNDWKV